MPAAMSELSNVGGLIADLEMKASERPRKGSASGKSIDQLSVLIAIALLTLLGSTARATDRTWDGGGVSGNLHLWGAKQNWGGASVPGDTDQATFSSVVGNSSTPSLGATAASIGGILYNSSAAGFTIGGTATLTINANSGTLGAGTGIRLTSGSANSQTINAPIALGLSQTWDIQANTLTVGGAISGAAMTLTKTGSGTLVFNTAATYTGGTTLSAGTLRLGAADVLPNSGTFTFAGGILAGNNFGDSIGPLSLTANSTLNLSAGGATPSLTFASASWTAGTLTINNWTGTGSGGTDDKIFITADPGSTFLSNIQFTGFAAGATWLGTGEIVPVPEPIHYALGIFGLVFAGVRVGRYYVARRRMA